MAEHRPGGPKVAVIGIDLDHFKEINDVFGHGAGDLALCALADRLRGFAGETGHAARLGGDEFCAIVMFEGEADLQLAVEHLENLMSRPLRLGEIETAAGASIAWRSTRATETIAEGHAQRRPGDVPRQGGPGQSVCFYDTEIGEAVRDRRVLVNDLRQAIANDELDVHYQVQTSVTNGAIRGYEALLRWTHAERGPISPACFIPLAEANGLILELGEWVLRRACRDAAQWEPG